MNLCHTNMSTKITILLYVKTNKSKFMPEYKLVSYS